MTVELWGAVESVRAAAEAALDGNEDPLEAIERIACIVCVFQADEHPEWDGRCVACNGERADHLPARSDNATNRQLDGRCTAWTREGGERCLNAAAPGKSLCAEPHHFGEPDPELDELLDEIGSGLGCTPYLDGGAIRKAEEALSKLRARLTPAGVPEQDRGAAAIRPAAEGIYPPGWPKCACGDYCMDGKATCGRVECL